MRRARLGGPLVAVLTSLLACSSSESAGSGAMSGVDGGATATNPDGSVSQPTDSGADSVSDDRVDGRVMVTGRPESVCRAAVLAYCETRQRCMPVIDPAVLGCRAYADLCPDYYFDSSDRTVEEIAGCVTHFQEMSCADLVVGASHPCARPGNRQVGQHCLYAAQCATGICEKDIVKCGVCAASTAKLGEDCATNGACPSGSFCHPVTKKCSNGIQYGGDGAPCDTKSDPILACEKDLLCVVEDGGTSGTCRHPGLEGEPCLVDAFTRYSRCAPGLQCRVNERSVKACWPSPKCGDVTCDRDHSYCAYLSGPPMCLPKAKLMDPCGGEVVCEELTQCPSAATGDAGRRCMLPDVGLLGQSCNPGFCQNAFSCRNEQCVVPPTAECPP